MNTEGENCGGCRFVAAVDTGDLQQPKAYLCRRNPPTPTPILMPIRVHPTPANPQGIGMNLQGTYSPTSPENWCGRWEAAAKKLAQH